MPTLMHESTDIPLCLHCPPKLRGGTRHSYPLLKVVGEEGIRTAALSMHLRVRSLPIGRAGIGFAQGREWTRTHKESPS